MREGLRCKRCGYELTPDSRFCENCGAPVESGTPGEEPGQVFTPRREHARVSQETVRARQGEPPQSREEHARQGQPPQNPDRRPRQGDAPRRDYDRAAEYEKIRQEQQQRARYRQENVGSDWEQSWEREQREAEDEGHTFTPVQYVLLGLIAVLIIALLTFGIFWLIGRTKDHSSENRVAMQTSGLQTDAGQNKQNNVISILDGGGEPQTAATQKQEPQTAAPTQTVQTEPQQDITLDYKEFTVTLPASWKGKYGITQSGSNYVFYQQASGAELQRYLVYDRQIHRHLLPQPPELSGARCGRRCGVHFRASDGCAVPARE